MSLPAGTRLGSYEVLAPLGAGGMGEVYRAKDTRLGREVAIKVLPEAFARDADRLARFTREAQVLASLNHPNIAAIYGIEEMKSGIISDQRRTEMIPDFISRALVMELVEGQDLSTLIARSAGPEGPALQLSDALAIARQIADALEAAHEQGVVHRDLKPQNIKVRADGTVKVLDFGLAKAMDPAGASGSDAMNSPTMTARMTQMGIILGTAAYMAPEQAKGKAVDRRADIWAFGAVLYEMLTGRRAFDGDDITEVLASVLKTEPAWNAIPASTPASVRRLLRRCLEKDPKKRLSSIGDARLDLDEHADDMAPSASASVPMPATLSGATMASAPARVGMRRWIWPAVVFGVMLAAMIGERFWLSVTSAGDAGLARVSIVAPPGETIYPDTSGVAISPDGTMVVFATGSTTQSISQLWIRRLGSLTAQRIENSDNGTGPFWSADSKRIGFFTANQLKTVAASGGRPEVLADTPNARGGAWNSDNVLLFAPDATGPIFRMSGSGGAATPATTLDKARKERGHRYPQFLPDGDHFLYAVLPGKNGKFDIFAGSLSKPADRVFIAALETAPIYAAPGYLIYGRQGVLTAAPFDAKALRITGDPVQLPDQPSAILDPKYSWTAAPFASISATGTLAYYSAPSMNSKLVWLNRAGQITGAIKVPEGPIDTARISPDGTQAALVRSTSPSESTIWIADLARGSVAPITSGHGRNDSPVWSPDGARIAFGSDRDGAQNIFVRALGDAAPERALYQSDVLFKGPDDWSPDGRTIAVGQLDPDTAQNIYALSVAGGPITPIVRGPMRDTAARFSPDGKWLSYATDETGQFQIMAQPFPGPGRAVRISQDGALDAWWSKDGREIVYVSDQVDSLWTVDLAPGATLRPGVPRRIATLPHEISSIDAGPDLQRFLVVMPENTGPGSITLVQHWRGALDQKK